MKHKRFLLLCFLLCFVLLPAGLALANEPAIHSVSIQADLLENGDIRLQEQWDVTVTSGTEWYLALYHMQGMEVTGLAVQDEAGIPYTYMESWDVGRSIDQKANRCGIVYKDDSDYELCWGVGSYGRHQFAVSYTITGFVKRYTDGAGFHHTFLSRGLSSPVEQAIVSISYPGHPLDESAADIWAFGFEGNIHFSGGSIVAQSSGSLATSEGIIIMAEVDPAFFPGARDGEGTFEAVKARAFEGSDYGDEGGLSSTMLVILVVLCAGFVLFVIYGFLRGSLPDVYYRQTYGETRSSLPVAAAEITQIPFEGDLSKTVALLSMFSQTPTAISIINYYLLKWLRENAISETTRQLGEKAVTTIQLNHSSYGDDRLEAQLYGMLASASEGGTLTQKSIEKWAYRKYNAIKTWYREYTNQAKEKLQLENITTQEHVRRAFVSATIDVLNDAGWRCATEVFGFKQYLLRCSQGRHSDIPEERIGEYLAYAEIFRQHEQMEDWYESHYSNTHYMGYYHISRTFRSSYQTGESRHSGSGGSSSGGGGGGSSGGGGGGSR